MPAFLQPQAFVFCLAFTRDKLEQSLMNNIGAVSDWNKSILATLPAYFLNLVVALSLLYNMTRKDS